MLFCTINLFFYCSIVQSCTKPIFILKIIVQKIFFTSVQNEFTFKKKLYKKYLNKLNNILMFRFYQLPFLLNVL